jgi:hypothetical protein
MRLVARYMLIEKSITASPVGGADKKGKRKKRK